MQISARNLRAYSVNSERAFAHVRFHTSLVIEATTGTASSKVLEQIGTKLGLSGRVTD
jgi:hypothetical protein